MGKDGKTLDYIKKEKGKAKIKVLKYKKRLRRKRETSQKESVRKK